MSIFYSDLSISTLKYSPSPNPTIWSSFGILIRPLFGRLSFHLFLLSEFDGTSPIVHDRSNRCPSSPSRHRSGRCGRLPSSSATSFFPHLQCHRAPVRYSRQITHRRNRQVTANGVLISQRITTFLPLSPSPDCFHENTPRSLPRQTPTRSSPAAPLPAGFSP